MSRVLQSFRSYFSYWLIARDPMYTKSAIRDLRTSALGTMSLTIGRRLFRYIEISSICLISGLLWSACCYFIECLQCFGLIRIRTQRSRLKVFDSYPRIVGSRLNCFEGAVALWCNPLTLKSEQSGRKGTIPDRANHFSVMTRSGGLD